MLSKNAHKMMMPTVLMAAVRFQLGARRSGDSRFHIFGV